MKKRTLIAEELDAAGIKVQYDEHVKRILSSRQVLARILQGAVSEYAGCCAEEITAGNSDNFFVLLIQKSLEWLDVQKRLF